MDVLPLSISDLVRSFSSAIELLGVLLIVSGVFCASSNALIGYKRKLDPLLIYNQLKTGIARTLLLGLEILVAADVIRTVALQPSIENLESLGLLILIRTVLSWALIVEIEERWPWNKKT
ncbi:MAG: DUF1622 domain-containing protein [Methanothrix sp.]